METKFPTIEAVSEFARYYPDAMDNLQRERIFLSIFLRKPSYTLSEVCQIAKKEYAAVRPGKDVFERFHNSPLNVPRMLDRPVREEEFFEFEELPEEFERRGNEKMSFSEAARIVANFINLPKNGGIKSQLDQLDLSTGNFKQLDSCTPKELFDQMAAICQTQESQSLSLSQKEEVKQEAVEPPVSLEFQYSQEFLDKMDSVFSGMSAFIQRFNLCMDPLSREETDQLSLVPVLSEGSDPQNNYWYCLLESIRSGLRGVNFNQIIQIKLLQVIQRMGVNLAIEEQYTALHDVLGEEFYSKLCQRFIEEEGREEVKEPFREPYQVASPPQYTREFLDDVDEVFPGMAAFIQRFNLCTTALDKQEVARLFSDCKIPSNYENNLWILLLEVVKKELSRANFEEFVKGKESPKKHIVTIMNWVGISSLEGLQPLQKFIKSNLYNNLCLCYSNLEQPISNQMERTSEPMFPLGWDAESLQNVNSILPGIARLICNLQLPMATVNREIAQGVFGENDLLFKKYQNKPWEVYLRFLRGCIESDVVNENTLKNLLEVMRISKENSEHRQVMLQLIEDCKSFSKTNGPSCSPEERHSAIMRGAMTEEKWNNLKRIFSE